jgi:hypothetical protein
MTSCTRTLANVRGSGGGCWRIAWPRYRCVCAPPPPGHTLRRATRRWSQRLQVDVCASNACCQSASCAWLLLGLCVLAYSHTDIAPELKSLPSGVEGQRVSLTRHCPCHQLVWGHRCNSRTENTRGVSAQLSGGTTHGTASLTSGFVYWHAAPQGHAVHIQGVTKKKIENSSAHRALFELHHDLSALCTCAKPRNRRLPFSCQLVASQRGGVCRWGGGSARAREWPTETSSRPSGGLHHAHVARQAKQQQLSQGGHLLALLEVKQRQCHGSTSQGRRPRAALQGRLSTARARRRQPRSTAALRLRRIR